MMNWNASSPDGTYLTLSSDQDWHIRIWRIDNQPDERLGRHNGKAVSSETLKQFVPHWDSLEWEPRTKGVGRSEIVRASDGDFRIALATMQGRTLTREQTIKEFRQSMAETE